MSIETTTLSQMGRLVPLTWYVKIQYEYDNARVEVVTVEQAIVERGGDLNASGQEIDTSKCDLVAVVFTIELEPSLYAALRVEASRANGVGYWQLDGVRDRVDLLPGVHRFVAPKTGRNRVRDVGEINGFSFLALPPGQEFAPIAPALGR